MFKPKIAVIGVGHLGSIHARIARQSGDCDLTAVCDTNAERLQQVAQELGVAGMRDYRELFGAVDAAVIATPTETHFDIARAFLNHGSHVLVEKPFTPTLREADALIRLAKKKGLLLQVGHVERFNSAFSAVQPLIKDPKFIECHRLSPFPRRSLDIGVVLDLMIHDIDIILGLVKSPLKKIEAVGVAVLTRFEDIANVRLTFANGCVCNITASRISDEPMRKIRIFLKDAYISLDYKAEQAYLYRRCPAGIAKDSLPIEREQPLQKELASFIECVRTNRAPLVSGEVARQALAVALAIRRRIWKS